MADRIIGGVVLTIVPETAGPTVEFSITQVVCESLHHVNDFFFTPRGMSGRIHLAAKA